jgi:hypothetical protein
VYVGHTGRIIEAKCKELVTRARLGRPEKFAVAEQRTDFNISILRKVTRYTVSIVEKTIDIRLHPNNFNTDRAFTMCQAWYSVTNMCKLPTETPMEKPGRT